MIAVYLRVPFVKRLTDDENNVERIRFIRYRSNVFYVLCYFYSILHLIPDEVDRPETHDGGTDRVAWQKEFHGLLLEEIVQRVVSANSN